MNFADFLFGGFFVHPWHPPSPRDPRNSPGPKKLLDTYNIKKQAQYQKDVKTDCDSDDDSGKRSFIINRRIKTTIRKDILW